MPLYRPIPTISVPFSLNLANEVSFFFADFYIGRIDRIIFHRGDNALFLYPTRIMSNQSRSFFHLSGISFAYSPVYSYLCFYNYETLRQLLFIGT